MWPLFERLVRPQGPIAAWLRDQPDQSLCSRTVVHKKGRSKADGRSCSSEVKPHGTVAGLAPQLGPSWTSSERTFEQCVSPSPQATMLVTACEEAYNLAQTRRVHISHRRAAMQTYVSLVKFTQH